MKRSIVLFMLMAHASALLASSDTTITLQSDAFKTARDVRIFTPNRYETDTSCFAVTVILDAQYDQFWNMATSNLDYLVDSYQVVPMLAVGIVSEDRGSDFAPPSAALKAHLREEVLPFIEAQYRVCAFRIVVGHSWGGAFVGHTAFSASRDLFQGYLGISPSFDAEDYWIPQLADSLFHAGERSNSAIYATAGTVGRRELESREAIARLDSTLALHAQSGTRYHQEVFEGTDHWSVVIPSYNNGLVALSREVWFDQWHFEQLAEKGTSDVRTAVQQWCNDAEVHYGYSRMPGPGDLRFYGNDFRDMEDYAMALELYRWGLELAPESARIQWEICWVLEQLGQVTAKEVDLLETLAEAQREKLREEVYEHFVQWITEQRKR